MGYRPAMPTEKFPPSPAAQTRPGGSKGPKAQSGPLVARPRLLDRLAQARHARAVVLRGPAGSGKTSLLLEWRREVVAGGADVAWLALTAAHDDPERFFDALMAALESVDARLVAEAAVLAGRGGGGDESGDSYESVVIALLRAVSAHPRALLIVLDDLHHIQHPGLLQALQMLLDFGPDGLQLALATRAVPPLALGRLRAQQQLLELDFDDLRFTPEESAQLVAGVLGRADPALVRTLHERSDGWVAGLKLISLNQRPTRRGTAVRDAEAFAAYFEHEVIGKLEPGALQLLLSSALPEQFNVELCAALLAPLTPPVPLAECERRLRSLQERGLFILPAGPQFPSGWWRLHPLLRNALHERLAAEPPEAIERAHRIAWQFFAERQFIYEAVHHALAVGADDEAAALVEARAVDLFVHGELRRLLGLVRMLPPAAVERRPDLRLWLGWAELFEQRLDACQRSIAVLQRDLAAAAPPQRYRLTLLRALYAVQRDDWSAAVTVLPELLDAPPDADAVALTARRSLLTWIYLYQGDYDRARRVQHDTALPLVDGQPIYGTALGVLGGRCLLGLSHALQGQFLQAERIYRDVMFEAERRGPACADPWVLGAVLLAETLYELNDPQGVLALLEPQLEVMERVSYPDSRLRLALSLSRSRWLLGRPLDALDAIEQALDHAERLQLDRLRAYMLLELLKLRLQRGESAQAAQLLAPLEALGERHAHAHSGPDSEISVVVDRARIRLWMHGGDMDRALQRLHSLVGLCEQRGRQRRVPYLQLQAAVAERTLGRHAQARALVHAALGHGHRLGLIRSLLDAHDEAPELIREALRDDELDAVLRFYAERLDAAARGIGAGRQMPDTSASPGLEALSPREAEVVQLLLQNLPNKRIASALDVSLDTVKWHLKNVYGKLGVSGRDEAQARLRR